MLRQVTLSHIRNTALIIVVENLTTQLRLVVPGLEGYETLATAASGAKNRVSGSCSQQWATRIALSSR